MVLCLLDFWLDGTLLQTSFVLGGMLFVWASLASVGGMWTKGREDVAHTLGI